MPWGRVDSLVLGDDTIGGKKMGGSWHIRLDILSPNGIILWHLPCVGPYLHLIRSGICRPQPVGSTSFVIYVACTHCYPQLIPIMLGYYTSKSF